jgi:hypothetical protein
MNLSKRRDKLENINEIVQDLEEKKSIIADAKIEIAQSEGRVEGLINQLKKDFGVDSLEKAEKKKVELETKKVRLEKSIFSDHLKLTENWKE